MLKAVFPISLSHLPKRLLLVGFLFLLLPIFSYIVTAGIANASILDYSSVMQSFIPSKVFINQHYPVTQSSSFVEFLFRYYKIILNLFALVVGIGLLGVKRWGYFLFLFFNAILIIDGLFRLLSEGFTSKFTYNLGLTLLYFVVLQYFLSKDISTPYLTLIPRSFRKKWRIVLPISGSISNSLNNSLKLTTIDISPSGCLAKVDGILELDEVYTLVLSLDSPWEVKARAVRTVDSMYGLQFEYSGAIDPLQKRLKSYLDSKLLPRFTREMDVTISNEKETIEGKIQNISEGGFFVSTSTNLSPGSIFDYKFNLFGITISGKAKVSWINRDGSFDKPIGAGMSYQTLNHSIIYSVLIILIREFYTSESRDR